MTTKYSRCSDPLYHIWKSMRARCLCKTNSRYHKYGGRGIQIAPEWSDFQVFKEWSINNGFKYLETKNTGKSLSLDRVDSDGGYYPSNCRWISKKENSQLLTLSLDLKAEILEEEISLLYEYVGTDYT